jgi:UDP-N-acetylmuramoylalanine--D-glutamate ligase
MGGMMMDKGLTAVVGLGKTGVSCVRYCVERGMPVAVTDSRMNPPGLAEIRACYPNVVVKQGAFDGSLLADAQRIIISPGVSLKEPLIAAQVSAGKQVLGDIELFVKEVKAPIVAITGSNGKSTVTTMVGEMARAAGRRVKVGGNLGTPVLNLLDRAEPELYVLELSSFQLETTPSLEAYVAVNLNLSPDHMDRYASFREYQKAKLRVYHNCGTAVINVDDPASFAVDLPSEKCLRFSVAEKANSLTADFYCAKRRGELFLMYKDSPLIEAKALPLIGRHQLANALAAMAIGKVCDFPIKTMVAALEKFKGLPHRCQFVAEIDQVRWYNDSKGTNVGATQAILLGIGQDCTGNLILIAGGLGKNADFTQLRDVVANYVSKIILFGEDKTKIHDALQDVVSVKLVADLAEAVEAARSAAVPGDIVLLSPACASQDMFRDFEDRGEQFMALVKDMA